MEFQKCTNCPKEYNLNNETYCSDDSMNREWPLSLCNVYVLPNEQWNLGTKTEKQSENNVKEEKHEEFTIWKTDTIRYPRTMMIHIKYTSLACWTMMASL